MKNNFFKKKKKRLDDIQAQVGEKIYSSIYSAGKLWSCFFFNKRKSAAFSFHFKLVPFNHCI